MPQQIILAIIGGVVTIMTALIGKLSFDVSRTKKDAKAARTASEKTEHSINNRPSSLSDRLEAVDTAVASVAETLEAHGRKLDTHTKDLRGVDDSVGILRGADRDLQRGLAGTQRDLAEHIRESKRSIELADSTERTVRRFLPLLEKHGLAPDTAHSN